MTPAAGATRRAPREHVCRRCYGPCRTHKGTVYGWMCQACVDDIVFKRHRRESA